jgi:hypothetical protein
MLRTDPRRQTTRHDVAVADCLHLVDAELSDALVESPATTENGRIATRLDDVTVWNARISELVLRCAEILLCQ